MALKLYMDHNVSRAITSGLRRRGIDVITAHEDSTHEWSDKDLLERVANLGRVLFTHDRDFLTEAVRCQRTGERFCGVVYAHPQNVTTGVCIHDLEIIAQAAEPEDMVNHLEYLPLSKR